MLDPADTRANGVVGWWLRAVAALIKKHYRPEESFISSVDTFMVSFFYAFFKKKKKKLYVLTIATESKAQSSAINR